MRILFITSILLFFIIQKLNAQNAILDTSFANRGDLYTTQTSNVNFTDGNDSAAAIVITKDNKMIIAGSAGNMGGTDMCVVKVNDKGSLDTTFGFGGISY